MVFKAKEAIINGVEAKFGSDLTKLDPWEWHVSLFVSQLD